MKKIKENLAKTVIILLGLGFAIIPEITMFFIYQFVTPATQLGKIVLFGIFWFGGVGLCFLFGALGIMSIVMVLSD